MRGRARWAGPAAELAALALAAAFLACSCGLLLFPDASAVVCFPDQENEVIASGEIPSLRFPFAPDRDSVEAIFCISGFSGRLSGRYEWRGEEVSFVPEPPFVFGCRYVLSFAGSFRDLQGVEYEVHRIVPFYVGSADEAALYVLATDPVSGGIASTTQEIRVEFSRPADPLSAPGGLTLSPDTPHSLRWENGDRILLLCPAEGWHHLSVYTLTLGDGLRDTSGAPLLREERVVFLVQEDVQAPTVVGITPAFNDPTAGFPPTGQTLEEVGCRDAIRVEFSEAMDREAVESAFHLLPAAAGRLCWQDDRNLVFAPDSDYQAGVTYAVILSGTACDRCGNALEGYLPVCFTPRASPIEVTLTFLDDGTVVQPGEFTSVAPLTVRLGPTGDCNLLLELAGGSFDTLEEKQAALEAVSLRTVFPPSGVPAPELIGISWEGDCRLSLTYGEVSPSTANQGVYYLLRIRGGPAGLATAEGNRLAADLEQLLRWEVAAP